MGILSAVSNKITQGSFWKLLIGTVVMLVFGYTGEAHLCPGGAWVGFAGGMCGWFFILFDFFGYLMGGVNDCSLNLIYNLADFVNKIAFCLAIWQAAKNETLEKGAALLPA